MTSFTYTWNGTFLATPADSEDRSLGAQRIRDTKAAVGERFRVDHYLAGDANDGKHLQLTLFPKLGPAALSLDPENTAVFAAVMPSLFVELFFQDNVGNIIQLTDGGAPVNSRLVGEIVEWPVMTLPSAQWVWANGQLLLAADYPKLFAVYGSSFGGNGVTTFAVPDRRGRVGAGADNMGGTPANRLTAASLGTGAIPGAVGGSELQQSHTHFAASTDTGHSHGISGKTILVYVGSGGNANIVGGTQVLGEAITTDDASAHIATSIASTGGGGSQNVQPTFVSNYIIFTG